jgi:hypothetical protein
MRHRHRRERQLLQIGRDIEAAAGAAVRPALYNHFGQQSRGIEAARP